MNEELIEAIKAEELILMEGYDDCIVGIESRTNTGQRYVVYDRQKVLIKLTREHGMTYDEALEFHEFNQACAWHGCKTPGFVDIYNYEQYNY